jgi:hypothetical protein
MLAGKLGVARLALLRGLVATAILLGSGCEQIAKSLASLESLEGSAGFAYLGGKIQFRLLNTSDSAWTDCEAQFDVHLESGEIIRKIYAIERIAAKDEWNQHHDLEDDAGVPKKVVITSKCDQGTLDVTVERGKPVKPDEDPGQTVRDFMLAVRDREIGKALDLMPALAVQELDEKFVRARLIDRSEQLSTWNGGLVDVVTTEREFSENEINHLATVDVTLVFRDGTEDMSISLIGTEEGWRIIDPVVLSDYDNPLDD